MIEAVYEDRPALDLAPGQPVAVMTDEGMFRRGKRQWHLGEIGYVVSRSGRHDYAWRVLVRDRVVLLFDDELNPTGGPVKACTVCQKPVSDWPTIFRGEDQCSDRCRKVAAADAQEGTR